MSSKDLDILVTPTDQEKAVSQADLLKSPEISENDQISMIQGLKDTLKEHELDPNFPADVLSRVRKVIEDDSDTIDSAQLYELVAVVEAEENLLLNDSPYTEVRAVVDATDDPSTPADTFRAWFLGTIFVFIGTGLDQFFSLRYPGIGIFSSVAQLVSYPCGVAMAKYLPQKRVKIGRWSFSLNPGPFNQKEHMLITVMSNVSYGGLNGTAYVTYIFQVLKLDMFYGEKTLANSAGFQILLALSTQLIGYGCAGLTRRFLVYPPMMIWPRNLAQIALIKALHNDNGRSDVPGWKISRYRFFLYAFSGMFLYFWFPDYIFQALSTFNWITWISPNNVKLAIITGSVCGLGLNPWPTFDWNIISYLFDPIITPWFSIANVGIGMAILGFIFAPALYFNNVFSAAYLPINSNFVSDNTGSPYNISKVLNADFTLNVEAYEAYSPPYLSTLNALLYSAFFAIYLATLVYVALYYSKELLAGAKSAFKWQSSRYEYKDVHNRLMGAYREAPEWWYFALLAISFIFACICCRYYDTGMPIWGIFFGIVLCIFLQVPFGMIQAVTNQEVTNNVIAEYIAGYAIPNKPIANMIFKSYGYISAAQSIQFASDLKLGHYMKIAPRTMFAAQTYATIIGALVSIGVNDWQLSNIADICTAEQPAKFTCPGSHTFFTASVIWGAVGPRRIFGAGGIYNPLGWGFLIGAMLPVPVYFLARRFPNSLFRYIHVPLLFYGMLGWAPYSFAYMWPAVVFGFIFNYYIKRRYIAWWQRYAYVLTTSFALGLSISGIVIFLAVQYKNRPINWWGNTVSYAGVDGGGSANPCVYMQIPAEGHF